MLAWWYLHSNAHMTLTSFICLEHDVISLQIEKVGGTAMVTHTGGLRAAFPSWKFSIANLIIHHDTSTQRDNTGMKS